MKKYSIKELVKKIQDKEISCVEVVDYYIKEIEKKEDKIDAFLLLWHHKEVQNLQAF